MRLASMHSVRFPHGTRTAWTPICVHSVTLLSQPGAPVSLAYSNLTLRRAQNMSELFLAYHPLSYSWLLVNHSLGPRTRVTVNRSVSCMCRRRYTPWVLSRELTPE